MTFSKEHIEGILTTIEELIPFLKDTLLNSLEKQKELLWHKESKDITEQVNFEFIYHLKFSLHSLSLLLLPYGKFLLQQ